MKLLEIKLSLTVFIAGASVMVFELLGSRAAAPYVGSTIYTWTSLIGVILAAMAVGYFLGGRLADKNPDAKRLGLILLAAGLSLTLAAFIKDPVMNFCRHMELGLAEKSLILTILIFALPSIFMAMVPPFSARLAVKELSNAGKTYGMISALSTVGSIVGTFAAGYFLMAFLGVNICFYGLAVVLLLLSLLWLGKFVRWAAVAGILLTFGLWALNQESLNAKEKLGSYEREALYSHVGVRTVPYQDGWMRLFKIGPEQYYSVSVVGKPDELPCTYSQAFDLVRARVEPQRVLVLGGAGYSYPIYLARRYPNMQIDTVEIDPQMWPLAKEFFGANEMPNLTNYFEDARDFLRDGKHGKYDMIFYDLFLGFALPSHTATVEAFSELKANLKADGVLVINEVDSSDHSQNQMTEVLSATLKKVFKNVEAYTIAAAYFMPITNMGLVATDRNQKLVSSEVEGLTDGAFVYPFKVDTSKGFVLTDDYSPTEYLTRNFSMPNNLD